MWFLRALALKQFYMNVFIIFEQWSCVAEMREAFVFMFDISAVHVNKMKARSMGFWYIFSCDLLMYYDRSAYVINMFW